MELKNCLHLYSDCNEIYAYASGDGIEMFGLAASSPKAIKDELLEFPIQTDEMKGVMFQEERNNFSFSRKFFINGIEFF
ncbi:hypothetical protein CU633_14950 [Bacillus sp. V3-13]|uniref:hypothetical protein n=1 Tax=Bacillus sp. V3-13 TaxID=2053728 RepID=UPI000C768B8B|nr:hypothetical protein [Bacillus sp. V3-13]PLR76646.1 hypothetical protein CU633_14950 [Bacillus sp. V3-13]